MGLNTLISHYPGLSKRLKFSRFSKFSKISKVLSKISKVKMSVSELPIASAVSMDDSVSAVEEIDIAAILAAAKTLEASDLFKLIKECTKEAEKRMKSAEKSTPAKRVAKKAGSAPKGKTPRQLRKNNAWVAFTLKDAQENGWEAFVVNSTRKDKETGETISEEIEMPASVLHEGAYVYEDSVTESTPKGRQIIHKEAMSLSKQRKETHPSWDAFLASYEEEPASETESVAKSTTSSKVTVRKTAAEKAAEKEEKDRLKALEKERKEAERAVKKAERDAKKAIEEQAKAERKAEREAKKAEKEAEAAKAKAAKEAAKAAKVTKTTVVKAAPVKAAAAPKPAAKAAAPVVKAAGGAGAKRPVVVAEWVPPTDDSVKLWSYKGKVYLRNSDDEIWLKAADGGLGEWQGVYLPAEDRIDDEVPEPTFDEE